VRKYEILYIIRPDIDEEGKKTLVERFDNVLKENGAEIIESKEWGRRRLAYEIQKIPGRHLPPYQSQVGTESRSRIRSAGEN